MHHYVMTIALYGGTLFVIGVLWKVVDVLYNDWKQRYRPVGKF